MKAQNMRNTMSGHNQAKRLRSTHTDMHEQHRLESDYQQVITHLHRNSTNNETKIIRSLEEENKRLRTLIASLLEFFRSPTYTASGAANQLSIEDKGAPDSAVTAPSISHTTKFTAIKKTADIDTVHHPQANHKTSAPTDNPPKITDAGIDLRSHLSAIENELIQEALEKSSGSVAKAARLLKLQRTTLVEKMRRYRETL